MPGNSDVAMMSSWYTSNLGDAMLAGAALAQLEALFISGYGTSANAGNAAIFLRHESEGRLHCELIAYFSPGAVAVANQFDAGPCKRPSRDGLSLHVGAEDSWRVLFPEPGR